MHAVPLYLHGLKQYVKGGPKKLTTSKLSKHCVKTY